MCCFVSCVLWFSFVRSINSKRFAVDAVLSFRLACTLHKPLTATHTDIHNSHILYLIHNSSTAAAAAAAAAFYSHRYARHVLNCCCTLFFLLFSSIRYVLLTRTFVVFASILRNEIFSLAIFIFIEHTNAHTIRAKNEFQIRETRQHAHLLSLSNPLSKIASLRELIEATAYFIRCVFVVIAFDIA